MTVRQLRAEFSDVKFGYRKAVAAFLSLFEPNDQAFKVFGFGRLTIRAVGASFDGSIIVEQGRATRLTIGKQKRRAK